MAFERNHALVMVTPDDPAYENKPSDWNAGHALSGADVGGIPYCPTATTETTSANLTYTETSGPRLTIGGTTAAAGLTITGGTITANSNPFLVTTTRNAAGTTFDAAIKAVITDTASAAGSLALQVLGGAAGATNLISVSKLGILSTGAGISSGGGFTTATSNTGFQVNYHINGASLGSLAILGWTVGDNTASSADTTFSRISAGLIGVGTGAQGETDGSLKLTDLDAVGDVDAATYHVGGAAGINATVTTADLVGKTITFTNGIITGYA